MLQVIPVTRSPEHQNNIPNCYSNLLHALYFQTKRTSDDLQTELFDLIGFDRIELIQLLLEHRDELVREHALNKTNMKQEIMSAAASKWLSF